jgi:hypothetical protein
LNGSQPFLGSREFPEAACGASKNAIGWYFLAVFEHQALYKVLPGEWKRAF